MPEVLFGIISSKQNPKKYVFVWTTFVVLLNYADRKQNECLLNGLLTERSTPPIYHVARDLMLNFSALGLLQFLNLPILLQDCRRKSKLFCSSTFVNIRLWNCVLRKSKENLKFSRIYVFWNVSLKPTITTLLWTNFFLA